ncbi:MAG: hypothetical protein JSS91_14740 [Bacteroidetes bacterium]|nr:hypothetical protein [Bacteroidota bacterium]
MKKFIILFALYCLSASSCNNDSVSSGNSDYSPYWEAFIGSDSALSHHYELELAVNNGSLSGSAVILDTNARNNGTLTGSVNGNSVSITADFPTDKYDFVFSGTKSDKIINGKFIFTHPVTLGPDTVDLALLYSENRVLNFGTPPAPNPYLFQTIFTTPTPTGPPVIFVHGMGTTTVEWDSLFAALDAGFKSRHNVYAYQYNWQDSIMINGRILKDSVDAKGLVNPIIVAHSMGGLVSRAYIASGGQITKLVTLGTPHRGTPLASLLWITPNLDSPGPNDMKVTGHFITSMLINSADVANRSKYFCIAGEMGGHFETSYPFKWVWNEPYYASVMNGIVMTGWKILLPYGKNDGLVNVWSAFFENGGVNLVFTLPQLYIDHMHLVSPNLAPAIFNYINSL